MGGTATVGALVGVTSGGCTLPPPTLIKASTAAILLNKRIVGVL
jgi:hypothetical protein